MIDSPNISRKLLITGSLICILYYNSAPCIEDYIELTTIDNI